MVSLEEGSGLTKSMPCIGVERETDQLFCDDARPCA